MAFVIKPKQSEKNLEYLPKQGHLADGRIVVLDHYGNQYEEEVHAILKYIVNEEGNFYPHDDMNDVNDFRAYYLSHDVFVCLDEQTSEVLGAFYVKPNFPGRSSHICNAGFIVKKSARGIGVGSFLVENYLIVAKDLGYRASLFNIVFVSNKASLQLYRKFGFKEIGIIPKAGNLKGLGYTDAVQFYYDFFPNED